jgi:hypothetical protein
MQKSSFAIIASLAGVFALSSPVRAQESASTPATDPPVRVAAAFAPAPTPGDNSVQVPTDIYYDGQVLMRVRTGAGGLTAGQRVNRIHERMVVILANTGLRASDVRVRPSRFARNGADIVVGSRLLAVVDEGLGQANGMSAGELARTWAADLKRTLPEINVYNLRAARRTYVARADRRP